MMFLDGIKKSATLLVGAGLLSLMMVGCGSTNGAADVGAAPVPGGNELVVMDGTNADQVLASSVSTIGKVAKRIDDLVDDLPGVGVASSQIAQASPGIDGSVAVSNDDVAFSLVSRDCSKGGSISVDSLSTDGGTVTFHSCHEKSVILDGTVMITYHDGEYAARFTNVNATFSTGNLVLSDAGLTAKGSTFDFAIASASAMVQGIDIGIRNMKIHKYTSGTTVDGSIATGCICCQWINVTTVSPLGFQKTDLVSGTIRLSGANGTYMEVMANPNCCVTTTLNGKPYATYDSIKNLPKYNAVCPLP
ncbi:MAG TPA: hypothetical protein ENK77_00745 [Epsilonproteobacteria bacterium]|nr:hypothetical protein [Campylobacterota bacterium]